ncbi:MAG: flavodoxin [Ruminococcus sp.]|nr:flavodoxin [Ruminococcus sp.]
MKKIISNILCIIMLVVSLSACSNNSSSIDEKVTNTTDAQTSSTDKVDETKTKFDKSLIVYYSATGSTKKVAETMAKYIDAEMFEIVPKEIYSDADLDWTDSNSRVSVEHNNPDQRNVELVSTKVENFEEYSTVYIGYPIWWGSAAWPVDTFIKANDFTGKTVIPFCTSASSGLGESGKLLSEMAGTGNWQVGIRFASNVDDDEVTSWLDSLK